MQALMQQYPKHAWFLQKYYLEQLDQLVLSVDLEYLFLHRLARALLHCPLNLAHELMASAALS